MTFDPPAGRGDLRGRRWTRRQADLLDRLQALFLAEGFTHFTLDEVAARLRCSKATLYALAPSKEQLVVTAVKHFFRWAAREVEAAIADISDVRTKVGCYLAAVGETMSLASPKFMSDMAAFGPAREIYERNSRAATERIRGFLSEGIAAGVFHDVHTAFTAEVVGVAIASIQQGEMWHRTGLSDAEAFTELSALMLRALQPDAVTRTTAAQAKGAKGAGVRRANVARRA